MVAMHKSSIEQRRRVASTQVDRTDENPCEFHFSDIQSTELKSLYNTTAGSDGCRAASTVVTSDAFHASAAEYVHNTNEHWRRCNHR
jgi:hypothetical protein